MNLSERLAQAAIERRRHPETEAQRVHGAPIESQPPAPLPPETPTETRTGLPLWQRPLVEVRRDAGLATVTSLPFQPRGEEAIDDRDGALAQTILMPRVWICEPVIDTDRHEIHLPRLATSESAGLASGGLRSVNDTTSSNLDDVAQEKVDGLYRRMLNATQQPRVTFGPIDLHDEVIPRADREHTCPQCGARAIVDIHDPARGRLHLSCGSCFNMWQERVAATVESDEPFMRD